MFSFIRSAALSAAVVVSGLTASAAVVTFQNGTPAPFGGGTYTGVQDTSLWSGGDADNNLGGFAVTYAGGTWSNIIVQFDVSSLAGQGTIQSAKLLMTPEFSSAADATFTYSVYQLADANAGWQEGTHLLEPATAGEATWNKKVHNTVGWVGSPGAATAGTDYLTPKLGQGTYHQQKSKTPTASDTISIDLPGSLIQHWVDGPNAGLILWSDAENAMQFISANTYYQPMTLSPGLEVTYTPVPEPATAAVLMIAGAGSMVRRRK